MNKFSDAEILQLRAFTVLAADIARTHAGAAEANLDAFFAADHDKASLIDLIGLVAEITFMNYTHQLTQVPVAFPAAQPLAQPVA